MNGKKESNWLMRVITGLVLLASNLIVGAAFGLLWVKLFVDIDMGLGGVGDVLGGIMVGTLLGLVAGALMVVLLSVRIQWVWISIVVVVAGLTSAGFALTATEREASPQPIVKKKFQPFFTVNLRVSHAQEILTAVPPASDPFPLSRLRYGRANRS